MSKFVNLEQIKVLANKVKSEDAALGTKLETVTNKVDNLVAAGGEANILEGVKVNGAALAISDKMVDILIASGEENGTISVNGAAVAIKGLAALAYKSEITEDELGEALKASMVGLLYDIGQDSSATPIAAAKADLDALTVRVGDIEKAGYQTAEQVQAAIAASGHAHFEVAETDPTAEGFKAQANVMYLYMNSKTKHYDIYAKVGESVVLLDDTTVDLSEYAKTADVTSAISTAIAALMKRQRICFSMASPPGHSPRRGWCEFQYPRRSAGAFSAENRYTSTPHPSPLRCPGPIPFPSDVPTKTPVGDGEKTVP